MKRIMMVFVLVLAVLFLSNPQLLEVAATNQPTGYLFDFFGTLCLLALLDVNARKIFDLGRHLLHMLFQSPQAPHHQTP